MRRRLLAALLLGLLTACGSTDEDPLASLRAMEEANLASPGSTRLGEIANDQQTGSITGPQSAEFGRGFGTDASEADVEAFFEAELARRGWIPPESLGAGEYETTYSTESRVRAWEKGDVFFRLAFRRRDEQGRLDAATLARYPTVYDVRLRARLPDPVGSPSVSVQAP